MTSTRSGLWAAVLLVLLSGCLPYSCRREESTALMPADSASRQIAFETPADTLRLLWIAGEGMEYPRTVRFSDDSAASVLYVSDVEREALLTLDARGSLRSVIEDVPVPYLAGIRSDTIAAFSPGQPGFHLAVDGRIVRSITVNDPERSREDLVYGAYNGRLYYKRVPRDGAGFIASVGPDGRLQERRPLDGPQWRRAGLLRTWGDTLVSLSGYRPVIDLIRFDEPGSEVDTLYLLGFDSPMLARSRSFVAGEISEPPLLTTSAAAAGNRLFVINLRAGWLQVDVFGRDGRLQRRLVEPNPAYRRAFLPQDIDARLLPDGSYQLAIVLSDPAPEVRLYEWRPDAPSRRSDRPDPPTPSR